MATPAQISSRERFSIRSRQIIEAEAVRDSEKTNDQTTLWKTIKGSITNTSLRYTISSNPIILFEWDLHDFWHTCIESAKVTDADDAGQDRLAAQILYAKEMGTLSRTVESVYQEAVTSDGKIWTDLPFMVPDFREFWAKSVDLAPEHRRNFAAFTARLIGLGVGGPGLSSCAIWLLRQTLEVRRPLMKSEDEKEISITELLAACLPWFRYCSHKLLRLSVQNYDDSPDLTAPGELALNSGIEKSGFSVERWVFWRNRFKELNKCGDETFQEESRLGFGMMISRGREMGLIIPGEAEYQARVTKYLADKLASKGPDFKGGVSNEGMSIHSDEE